MKTFLCYGINLGTSGSECPATANYMRLSVDADKGVFEYCISFTPEIDNKTFRIKLINSQLDKFGGIKSFDGGQCLYLPIKLGSDPLNLNATHPSSGDNVMIQISYKKKKRLGDCVHLFNILFKRIMKKLSYYQFNRNYYDMKHTIAVPQHKLEVLPGYVTRVDEYEGGLLLCLDCHHKVLRTQTVLNLLVQLRDTQRERFKREAENMILGSHVLTRYIYHDNVIFSLKIVILFAILDIITEHTELTIFFGTPLPMELSRRMVERKLHM